MLDVGLNAGGVVDVVDFAWNVGNGWVGLNIPAFTLTIPNLVHDGGMCENGQGTTCDMGLQLLEIAWRDGAAVACFE